jgi:hypothetical protein
MSKSRDSKSHDHIMRVVLTEGQTHILPDKAGIKKVAVLRVALSSYYAMAQPKKQTLPSLASNSVAKLIQLHSHQSKSACMIM